MVKLKEGEMYCPECKGSSLSISIRTFESGKFKGQRKLMACPICHATGKMDWIQFVFGELPVDYRSFRGRFWLVQREQLKMAKRGHSEDYWESVLKPLHYNNVMMKLPIKPDTFSKI